MIQGIRRTSMALVLAAIATLGTSTVGADCLLEILGTAPVPATKVAATGTLAVVSSGLAEADLIDLSGLAPVAAARITAAHPVKGLVAGQILISTTDPSGNPIQKNVPIVFLLEADGANGFVEAFDVTSTSDPRKLGSTLALSAPPNAGTTWQGMMSGAAAGYVLVGESSTAGGATTGLLDVVKLDPATGAPVSKAATYASQAGTPSNATGITGVALNGTTLMLALGGAGVELADATNPEAIARLSNLAVAGGALEAATGGASGWFFVASGASGWTSIDATTPAAPVSHPVPTTLGAVTSISARSNTVVAGFGTSGFKLYDVSSPGSPILVNGGDTPGDGAQVLFTGSIGGNPVLLVADGAAGLVAYDIANCLCGRQTGSVAGRSVRLVVAGNYVYHVDGISKLSIAQMSLDTSGGEKWIRLNGLGSATLSAAPAALAVGSTGRYVYVVGTTSGGQGKLEIVDVFAVNSPSVVASFVLSFLPQSVGVSHSTLFVGGAVDSTASSDGIIQAFSIQAPTTPQPAGELRISTPGKSSVVRALSPGDAFSLAAADGAGVVSFKVSGSTLQKIEAYVPAGNVTTLGFYGHTFYASVQGVGVEGVDVSTAGDVFTKISSLTMTTAPLGLSVFFGRLGAALGSVGYALYDTFDPARITFLEGTDTTGSAQAVALGQLGPGKAALIVSDTDGGLLAFDISGCLAPNQRPSAAFTVTPSTPTAGQAATFTDNSTNTPTSWEWTFGDGGTSIDRNPQHVYAGAGVYQVSLKATNIVGEDTTTRWVFVGGSTGNPATGGYPNVWWVPASARATGASNTDWRTDLAIYNRTWSTAHVLVSFLPSGRDNSTGVATFLQTLAPNSSITLADVVGTNLGQGNASGGLQIAADVSSLVVTSRTYNAAGASGTYGQYIGGQASSLGLTFGVPGVLIQLSHSSDSSTGYRTNIGFLNGSATTSTVQVTLFGGNGVALATPKTWTLRPFEYQQVSKIFEAFGIPNADNARAEIVVTSGTGPVFSYASVVDNRSGDPVFQPASK